MLIQEHFKRNLWHIIYGTRGGYTRLRIIQMLIKRPYNANHITKELNLDYKTVQHHLKVMAENNIIISSKKKYGKVYFLSNSMKENSGLVKEALAKFGEK